MVLIRILTCKNCGDEYPQTRTGRGRPSAYCSDRCRSAVVRERNREAARKTYAANPVTKPTVPCSQCGKMLYRGTGALPADQRICRDCRALNRIRVCEHCNSQYDGYKRARFCSRECYQDYSTVNPDLARAERKAARYRDKCRARRALKRGLPVERYTTAEIAERDGYICGLCEKPVDMTLSGLLDDYGPTIDHITPIAKGGGDTRDNVQLAHRVCNMRKGART